MRCPSCGGYEWSDGVCKFCGYLLPKAPKPRFDMGNKVDVFKLAEGLKVREEQERRKAIPKLSGCPHCHKRSLFYNSIGDNFECLNLKCQAYGHPILSSSEEYKSILLRQEETIN